MGQVRQTEREGFSRASTYMKPHAYPTGIVYVAANGDLVVGRSKLTGTLAGKVLTRATR